jgi:hypothetical protein
MLNGAQIGQVKAIANPPIVEARPQILNIGAQCSAFARPRPHLRKQAGTTKAQAVLSRSHVT